MIQKPKYTATYPRNTSIFSDSAEITKVLAGPDQYVCGIVLQKGHYKPPKGFIIAKVRIKHTYNLLWIEKE